MGGLYGEQSFVMPGSVHIAVCALGALRHRAGMVNAAFCARSNGQSYSLTGPETHKFFAHKPDRSTGHTYGTDVV